MTWKLETFGGLGSPTRSSQGSSLIWNCPPSRLTLGCLWKRGREPRAAGPRLFEFSPGCSGSGPKVICSGKKAASQPCVPRPPCSEPSGRLKDNVPGESRLPRECEGPAGRDGTVVTGPSGASPRGCCPGLLVTGPGCGGSADEVGTAWPPWLETAIQLWPLGRASDSDASS